MQETMLVEGIRSNIGFQIVMLTEVLVEGKESPYKEQELFTIGKNCFLLQDKQNLMQITCH